MPLSIISTKLNPGSWLRDTLLETCGLTVLGWNFGISALMQVRVSTIYLCVQMGPFRQGKMRLQDPRDKTGSITSASLGNLL